MDRKTAEQLLSEAKNMNEGAWIKHSYNVARLAEKIANKAGMDHEKAYIWGLLHDIGRRNGNMQARHALEGFHFLSDIGFDEGARICLTHTFQYKDIEAIYDTWDCTNEEKHFMAEYLNDITYNDYDKLIQLCDALSLANGYCYAEKKMVNSVLKFSFKDTTINKWKAILELKEYFDAKISGDVYLLF
ncbi:MAG: HD domain-containing protein [Lachnospiraceae bacterium]|nr:HD domain-containing protein [Lachnospiraceae bacterium]